MSDEERKPDLLDRGVEWLADLMDRFDLNGTRLRWRWNKRRRDMGESIFRGKQVVRSAQAQHRMCPECRNLVPKKERVCDDCGTSMDRVSRPGYDRAVSNALPGVRSASSWILLVNGFWFMLMLLAHVRDGGSGMSTLMRGFSMDIIISYGAGLTSLRQVGFSGVDGLVTTGLEWWRFVTPIFLHGSLLHFAFNSMFFLQMGRIAEQIYGSTKLWVIYLGSGIAGTLLTINVHRTIFPNPYFATVGASGALFGVLGMLVVFSLRFGSVLGDLRRTMFRFFVYLVVISLVFPVDHFNHLGGMLFGMLAGLLVKPRGQDQESPLWRVLAILGILVVLLAFVGVARLSRP